MMQRLRREIAELKAAPIYNKGAAAEKALDAALAVLADFERRILQLEERAGHGNGKQQQEDRQH